MIARQHEAYQDPETEADGIQPSLKVPYRVFDSTMEQHIQKSVPFWLYRTEKASKHLESKQKEKLGFLKCLMRKEMFSTWYLEDTHNESLGRNTECWGTFNLHLWFSFCNMSNVFHEKGLQAEFTIPNAHHSAGGLSGNSVI